MDNLLNLWKTQRKSKPIRTTLPVSQISLAGTGILPLPQPDSYRVWKCRHCFTSATTLCAVNKPQQGPCSPLLSPCNLDLNQVSMGEFVWWIPCPIWTPSTKCLDIAAFLLGSLCCTGSYAKKGRMRFEQASLLHSTRRTTDTLELKAGVTRAWSGREVRLESSMRLHGLWDCLLCVGSRWLRK